MRTVSVGDILSGNIKLPFASRNVWKANQLECPDLRRVKAHLTQGTRPSKKLTNIHNVKRYLNIVSIARDGLLVAKYSEPLVADRECIVVPRPLLPGLLTALHIKLQHPSMHQLRKVVKRYFFALDMDAVVKEVSQSCHQCASLRNVRDIVQPQSSEPPPDVIGARFAADLIRWNRQNIFVLRECVTAFSLLPHQ